MRLATACLAIAAALPAAGAAHAQDTGTAGIIVEVQFGLFERGRRAAPPSGTTMSAPAPGSTAVVAQSEPNRAYSASLLGAVQPAAAPTQTAAFGQDGLAVIDAGGAGTVVLNNPRSD